MTNNQNETIKTEAATTHTAPPPSKPDEKKARPYRNLLYFLAAVITSVTLTMLYLNVYGSKQTSQLNASLKLFEENQAKLNQEHLQTVAEIEQKLNSKITETEKLLQSALHERWYQSTDWILLKAKYYLELAKINTEWSHDTASSIVLLKNADELLATVSVTHLSEVREAIAAEETALMQIRPVDTTGILLKLGAIENALKNLKPMAPLSLATAKTNLQPEPIKPLTWQDHLKQSLKTLDRFIMIRHQDEVMTPLLTPAYVTVLTETIQLNLQTLQWTVLVKNQAIYQQLLSQLIDYIQRVFDAKNQQTIGILTQLQALQSVQLTEQKPASGHALQLLNDLIQSKQSSEFNPSDQTTLPSPSTKKNEAGAS